jgi:hypothetical protein
MKLAIVGSRTFSNYAELVRCINLNYDISQITDIISGGAKGADSLAEIFAKENNINLIVFKADWDKYGKRAGFIRNCDIIDACDSCIAFWDGHSAGTKHDIELCRKKGKECKICLF